MRIGFVGLGVMGTAMSKRLLSLGYELVVWNRTISKAKPLEELGAKVASSPVEVAEKSDYVHMAVADDHASRAVVRPILKVRDKRVVVVNHSTVTPMLSVELYEEAREKGHAYLEVPVLGSWTEAEKGELLAMVGGDREVYEEVLPVLRGLSKEVVYVGEIGKASAFKLAVNLMLFNIALSLSESIALVESWGVDSQLLLDFMRKTWLKPVADRYGERLRAEEYPLRFRLVLASKDLLYAVRAGHYKGQDIPLTSSSAQTYLAAARAGFGDKDYSRIYHYLKRKR